MDTSEADRADFISYPTNRVVGTITDARGAEAAITALLQSGFGREDIDILHGDTGVQRLDIDGAEHGFLAQFQRTLIRTGAHAEEYRHFANHLADVRAGRYVIMVLAPKREHRMLAADILNSNGSEFVAFYGRWAWEGLKPEQLPSSASPDVVPEPHPFATRPEEIPALFVQAWNLRDADALASLFDVNADFVNVTGLWWHDRDAIRDAHAYGLERIFNESTLSIDEARIRPLSADVAVVHAQMTLSGQTPVGDIRTPGTRTTIFSFVVHSTGGRWQCAAAQNTDVIPHMETNVVGDDGRFRPANYRTGRVSA